METENQRSIGSDGWDELHSDLMSIILMQLDVKTLSSCSFVCKTWNRVIWSRGFINTHRRHSISNVLIKLDVKTLATCRYVCKTWNSVISSRGFINAHRRQSISRGLSDILFVHVDRDKSEADGKRWIYKFTMVSGGTIGTYNSNSIKVPNRFSMVPMASNSDLLCFVDLSCVVLCNPRTGQVHTLPKPPIPSHYRRRYVFGYVDSMRQYVLVGLFYDKIVEKYKMVKFSFSSNYECERHSDTSCSCSITSSSWKEIEEACQLGRRIWEDRGILINNSVYWWDYGRKKPEIVSLELENENDKIKIISFPNHLSQFDTLIDLKGTLAAGLGDYRSFDIWVVEDQFNNSSPSRSCGWVRKYSINMANILAHPKDGYYVHSKSSRNGELILTVKTSGLNKHYICNPEKGSFRALIDPCSGASGPLSKCMTLGFFWESLFSFGVNTAY